MGSATVDDKWQKINDKRTSKRNDKVKAKKSCMIIFIKKRDMIKTGCLS